MSDPLSTDAGLKGTVWFTRKVSDGNYGSSDFGLSIQFDIPEGADGEAIITAARAASVQAKAVVFEQLGIEHTLDASGVVTEQVRRAFPGAVVQAAPSTSATVTSSDGANVSVDSDTPPHASDTTDAAQKRANKEWAVARYAASPASFYDNRPDKASGKYKATSPDLKHKASGIGIWLG